MQANCIKAADRWVHTQANTVRATDPRVLGICEAPSPVYRVTRKETPGVQEKTGVVVEDNCQQGHQQPL